MSQDDGKKTAILEPAARMKQLVEMSHNITIDRHIAIQKYFNSGREIIKSAVACEQKGDIERAFVLYLRYMTLFLEKLIHHPEYSKADKTEKTLVKMECNKVFDLAEDLKKRILEKYAKEYEEAKKNPESSSSKSDEIEKRSFEPVASAPTYCDEIDITKLLTF